MSTNEELVSLIRSGQNVTENMEKLFLQNQRFIMSIARSYSGRAEIEDLMQNGFLALYPAAEHYDPAKGVRFLTYAEYWIRLYMERSDKPLPDGVRLVSLDTPIQGADGCTLEDLLPDEENPQDDLVETLYNEDLKSELWKAVSELGEIRAEVIRSYYQDEMTIPEISEKMALPIHRVAYSRKKSLDDLRKSRRLRPYLKDLEETYSQGLRCTGVSYFRHTGESSTERAAIRLMEREEQRQGIMPGSAPTDRGAGA